MLGSASEAMPQAASQPPKQHWVNCLSSQLSKRKIDFCRKIIDPNMFILDATEPRVINCTAKLERETDASVCSAVSPRQQALFAGALQTR